MLSVTDHRIDKNYFMKANLSRSVFLFFASLCCLAGLAHADSFGSGTNTFTIPFVPIGDAGNAQDRSFRSDGTAYGAVSYDYNISTYAISQADIDAVTALGVVDLGGGAWAGNQPAADISWYQAVAFVNWLNASQGYSPAYNLTDTSGTWSMTLWSTSQAFQVGGGAVDLFRNANAHYFLPSENEYYKAAYYDPNKGGPGVGGYWEYATGSATLPTAVASGTAANTAVYNQDPLYVRWPSAVNSAGGLSPYGTMGQSGNVSEWMESPLSGDTSIPNDFRVLRAGQYWNSWTLLVSSARNSTEPTTSSEWYGFRVASIASVPEPSSWVLIIGSGLALLAWRRRT